MCLSGSTPKYLKLLTDSKISSSTCILRFDDFKGLQLLVNSIVLDFDLLRFDLFASNHFHRVDISSWMLFSMVAKSLLTVTKAVSSAYIETDVCFK